MKNRTIDRRNGITFNYKIRLLLKEDFNYNSNLHRPWRSSQSVFEVARNWHLTLDPQSRNDHVPEDVGLFFCGKSGWRWCNSCCNTRWPLGTKWKCEQQTSHSVSFRLDLSSPLTMRVSTEKFHKGSRHETIARLKFELLHRFCTTKHDSSRRTCSDFGDACLHYPFKTPIRADDILTLVQLKAQL